MPNLIEQQDLLKGLTDQRLSMLMQNPDATIPPFLVAAEAQRRQAIRAQYSGGPDKNESVVDSLTRQMAGTPENVNANPQAPAAPTPQQAGIAGLQQGMAYGGPVRRFNALGYVAPTSIPIDPRVQEVADQWNVSLEEAKAMISNNPSLAGTPSAKLGLPFKITEENRESKASPVNLGIPVLTESPAQTAQRRREDVRNAKYEEMYTYPGYTSPVAAASNTNPITSNTSPTTTPNAPPTAPRDPSAGTKDSSLENKYNAQREGFRNRYEELLAANQPSSWERAQKWFDASQAFFQPNTTTGEMIADALGAFGSGMAKEKAASRQADIALKEGMLNLDMQYAKEDRDVAAAAANRELERAYKLQDEAAKRKAELEDKRVPDASSAIRALGDLIDGIDKQLESGDITDPKAREDLMRRRGEYANRLSTIMSAGGFVASPTMAEINAAANAGK